jgi:hypothetical protein
MAMHHDLVLDIDLAAGPGVLPLDADGVAAVFRAQNLIWSAAQAVRVLADTDPDEVRPPRSAPLPWFDGWTGALGPRRLPKLPVRKPAAEQLSLFD